MAESEVFGTTTEHVPSAEFIQLYEYIKDKGINIIPKSELIKEEPIG